MRAEWPRLMATLARDLGDLAAAEDAAQDAAAIALERWIDDGIPDRPGAWITTVARRRALDRIRRERTGRAKSELLARLEEPFTDAVAPSRDDQLGLFFGCCHPALGVEAQIALTLRCVGGLTTAEIARAFLVPEATVAQRVVRAKRKIAAATIPFRVPTGPEMLERVRVVHHVLYLVFNEGTYPTTGVEVTRLDLADEAVRLAGLLADLLVDDAESIGLHALFLFVHARRAARTGPAGRPEEPVLLREQDRNLWSRPMIAAAQAALDRAMRLGRPGPYQIEAAIQALHAEAAHIDATDWAQIHLLYRRLLTLRPTPIVELNAAVALGEVEGPVAALLRLDRADLTDGLADYAHFHAARAEFLSRAGRLDEAIAALERALALPLHEPDRRLLARRLAELTG
ncbi:MAG: DUF6596 domain-containing protein [Acidimicrobiales bacterium]